MIVYCVPDAPDKMTRAWLYISAVRTRTHVHEEEPCAPCLGDMMGLGAHGFALLNLLKDREDLIYRLSHRLNAICEEQHGRVHRGAYADCRDAACRERREVFADAESAAAS